LGPGRLPSFAGISQPPLPRWLLTKALEEVIICWNEVLRTVRRVLIDTLANVFAKVFSSVLIAELPNLPVNLLERSTTTQLTERILDVIDQVPLSHR
jgi:hypothetical protein